MRRSGSRTNLRYSGSNSNIIILAIFFVAGALIGFFFAGLSSGSSYESMASGINSLISNASSGSLAVRLLDAFTSNIKLPLVIFLLGLSSYGTYVIPLVFGAKGFLLAFTCSAFVKLMGLGGLISSVAILLPTNLIVIPVMLFLGVQALTPNKRNYYEKALFCLALVIIGALVEAFIAPKLLVYLVSKFGIL